ncbi:hypothetical protein QMN58_29355, partial [Escherichia coli]|nr:hypothetical protein [Escherichia coli]
GRCVTAVSLLTAPYPLGQIKHLACKVEGNPLGVTYNHQVVGIHPTIRFDSLVRPAKSLDSLFHGT